MSVLVPKSMKKGLSLEEVEAFYSLEPVSADNVDYDFDKQINKILKHYAKSNVNWNCDTSVANGKCTIRAMIKNEPLRWNKKHTGYKPVWKQFDNWRKNRILAYSNITDEEREIMKQDIICETSVEQKLKSMTSLCSKQKKDITTLKQENVKLKALLMKYEGIEEEVDAETGEVNPNFIYEDKVPTKFNIQNNTAEDYLNSDDPWKLFTDTKNKAFHQLVKIFTIHRKGVFFNNCDELCDTYEEFLTDEDIVLDDPRLKPPDSGRMSCPVWYDPDFEVDAEVDLLEKKFDELKTD